MQDKTIKKSKRKVTDWALWCRCLCFLQCYKTLLSKCNEEAHLNHRGRLKGLLPVYILIWCNGGLIALQESLFEERAKLFCLKVELAFGDRMEQDAVDVTHQVSMHHREVVTRHMPHGHLVDIQVLVPTIGSEV